MSLLDIDERLLELVEIAEFDRSPLTDIKHCGPCDIGLIEGAVCNAENVHVLREFRAQLQVPGRRRRLRDQRRPAGAAQSARLGDIFSKVYSDRADGRPRRSPTIPELPLLLDKVYPIHDVVRVDYFMIPAVRPRPTPCGNSSPT